jgi:hypothetical protein
LEDLEAPKRQTSLDGEAIKIVIHDVDSGQLTTASKRRIILRRDPNEKAHRSIQVLSKRLELFSYFFLLFQRVDLECELLAVKLELMENFLR